MFVTTFYSFKGGVGRTMALMNVACELAKKKKVLVVDFDLEAPGISTFALCKSAQGKPGLVEYIISYQLNNIAPDATDYVVKCDRIPYVATEGAEKPDVEVMGDLFVMPAGEMHSSYGSKFGQIDWNELYEHRDGYLLIEDLKAQWAKMGFDYVFIDSRTGHTDSGGICTRQLPDALVAVFSPNEQNLVGMKLVLDEVRSDAERRQLEREYLFLASRIPLLDDEHSTLERMLARFQKTLGYGTDNSTQVHNYDSLSLIDQEVFVCSRPRTRLSTEYKTLARLLQSKNVQDEDGAAAFLDGILRRRDLPEAQDVDDTKLEKISAAHKANAEIMQSLALIYYVRRDLELASVAIDAGVSALDNAVRSDLLPARIHGLKIRIRRALNQNQQALEAALACLELAKASRVVLVDAIRTVLELEGESLQLPSDIPVLRSASFRTLKETAVALNFTRRAAQYGARILRFALSRGDAPAAKEADAEVALALISGGAFTEAMSFLAEYAAEDSSFRTSIIYLFNYAMADWGANRRPNSDLFGRVIERFDSDGDDGYRVRDDANFHQCIALTYGVLGKREEARGALAEAYRQIRLHLTSFSCWSYQPANRATFEKHCEEIRCFIEGDERVPLFIVENARAESESRH